jgi:hypothetical protein
LGLSVGVIVAVVAQGRATDLAIKLVQALFETVEALVHRYVASGDVSGRCLICSTSSASAGSYPMTRAPEKRASAKE